MSHPNVAIITGGSRGIGACSGQLKLATVLEFFQYSRSDSLGVSPPLY
ncbi:hypothetical protein VR7878_03771 [Vibrio ruber DSM 16370]|uniref:Uncharacterized protein n=1 Tax=Vibrio ruber (strain DSM 16370 / JCM 11486 / BCRC 17186 / CECT 7878 / LMG 23124 / VR1) TaxID=1123498 RepID=A0A1R4LTE2_VIBR1|nr:hypothetical protein VR7878_03771 [Vibrio ruber DSM 16370]